MFASASTTDDFYIAGWGYYGGTNMFSTLEVYTGTLGDKEGTFLKYCPDGYMQEGFHTTKSNADILAELQAMKALGYTGIQTQVYTAVNDTGAYVCNATNSSAGSHTAVTTLVGGEWVTFTMDINVNFPF